MHIAKIPSAFTHASRNIAKLFRSMPTFHLLPACLPSQFASSKLPISLVSLLLLWTGPVKRLFALPFHDIDVVSACHRVLLNFHLVLFHSFLLRASLERGTSVLMGGERMSYLGALDRHFPSVVRAVDPAGHSDSAPFGCDLRTDYAWCC
jgi:hypothetical protein